VRCINESKVEVTPVLEESLRKDACESSQAEFSPSDDDSFKPGKKGKAAKKRMAKRDAKLQIK
jgi:hypothetical protein